MYGYVFITTNSKNGMKYIGRNLSVVFDKNYFGDDPKLIDDIARYGVSNFSCKMLMPYESDAGVEWGLKQFIDEYSALTDPSFYNCNKAKKSEAVEDKPKTSRSRKKKADEE